MYAVGCDNCIFVFGGYDGTNYLASCEKYECSYNKWSELPEMPVCCSDMAGVQYSKGILILGGYNSVALR